MGVKIHSVCPMRPPSINLSQQTWDDFLGGVSYGQTFQRQRKVEQQRSSLSDRKPRKGDPGYSASYLGDLVTGTHPDPDALRRMNGAQRAGVPVGRVIGDVTGFGTQSYLWNIHPLDVTSTHARQTLGTMGATPAQAQTGAWAAANMLGFGSGNWNPLNLAEGGRQRGFEAISADEKDPRKSTNPALDMLLWRGMFGRTGRLLPFDAFTKERPDVSYEEYENYKEYLRDPGLFGVAKATWGIDGPEARIVGYRVTPLGVAAALGTIAGTAMLVRGRR